MDLRISFMGVIASVTGMKHLALSVEGTPTLRMVIDQLEHRFGTEFGKRVYRNSSPPRQLQLCTRIFVNRELVGESALDEALTPVGDSPEILIYLLPAVCGG